jgi:hypothetical protein
LVHKKRNQDERTIQFFKNAKFRNKYKANVGYAAIAEIPAIGGDKYVGVHCKETETDDRMTKEFLLHKDKKEKKANRTVKHIWFLPTHKANTEKPKELANSLRTQTE